MWQTAIHCSVSWISRPKPIRTKAKQVQPQKNSSSAIFEPFSMWTCRSLPMQLLLFQRIHCLYIPRSFFFCCFAENLGAVIFRFYASSNEKSVWLSKLVECRTRCSKKNDIIWKEIILKAPKSSSIKLHSLGVENLKFTLGPVCLEFVTQHTATGYAMSQTEQRKKELYIKYYLNLFSIRSVKI